MQFVSLKTNRSEVRHSAILHPLDLEKFNCQRGRKRVTIWQPNSFTNPPQFAFSPKLNFPVLPRLAFIIGRNALIFQNRFAFTSFFRNFADKL